MSKVVYLIEQPLTDWNYQRFGIQTWIDRGWDVEVWDLTPLLQPQAWQTHLELGGKIRIFDGYSLIESNKQLRRRYSTSGEIDYFVDLIGDTYRAQRIKLRLVKAGAIRVICFIGSVPIVGGPRDSGVLRKLRKALAVGPIKASRLVVNAMLFKALAHSLSPGLIVVSGQDSIPATGRRPQGIIKAHNLDYDVYKAVKRSMGGSKNDYAVFIDQDYCFHPEFIYQGATARAIPENYFPAICKGLRRIAQAASTDLRIAAHPRSRYRQRNLDYFEGIPIELGRTAELIADCKVVMCHDSTAIQFAVLFEKPIVFVTTDELDSVFMDSSYKRESIGNFAAALGKSVINLDRDLEQVDWGKELAVDFGKYAEYRNKYIKTDGSEESPLWDIVIAHMESSARLA